ncbi:MAG: deferrochelatase/peroxidase EfeB, partial [Humibacter sp.]
MSQETTRRGLLGALAAGSAGAVAAAITASAHAGSVAAADVEPSPSTSYPFEGAHQAGILEDPQRAAVLVSFVATSIDRAALQSALKTL